MSAISGHLMNTMSRICELASLLAGVQARPWAGMPLTDVEIEIAIKSEDLSPEEDPERKLPDLAYPVPQPGR
jgi:hypothetical protein